MGGSIAERRQISLDRIAFRTKRSGSHLYERSIAQTADGECGGDPQNDWDTDPFPNDPAEMTLALYEILRGGGLGRGILDGARSLEDLWQHARETDLDPEPVSGRQELLESRVRWAVEGSLPARVPRSEPFAFRGTRSCPYTSRRSIGS